MTTKSVKFALLAISALGAGGTVFANTLPQGGVVQQGAAGIQYTGDTLNIDQQSDKAIISWKSFSVGRDNTVNFNQPSSDSATLNRVTGDFTSEIAGRINSNGSVFLVNPNGIMITADGVIDTGGFVASTLDIDNNDFLNGDYTFTKNGKNGVVSNQGSISVDDGGFVALLGGAVKNDGTVRALVGKVGFAGGEKIVMSFGNNDFLRVEVPTDIWDKLTDWQGNKVSATVDLGGTIDSRGGFIDITVADASDILRQTISIDGVVSANTVSSTDGVISISGGTVGITGNGRITADADYGTAGTIAIEADTIDSSGMVSAIAQNGTGGMIKVALQHGANLNASTRFDVSGRTKGGSLSFIGGLGKSGTKVLGSADFKADSTDGKGGYIDISNKGGLVGLLSGTVSASGKTQGGRIRLGGAFQGGGYDPKTSSLDKKTQDLFVTRWSDNSSLFNAGKTSLGTGVTVNVSSESGTGGTAILWADHTTNNYASIDATGATGGGAVEISGKKRVDSFGLNRVSAGNGVILLDPKNVVIGTWGSALEQVKKIANGFSLSSGSVALDVRDYFGIGVSLSADGSKLAVGAYADDDGGDKQSADRGAVYLYTVGGSGDTWGSTVTQAVKLSHGASIKLANGNNGTISLADNDGFGSSVSLSTDGDKLAVGAYGDGDGGSNRGAVYLYTVGGSGDTWGSTVTQAVKLSHGASIKLANGNNGTISLNDDDNFGRDVSLNDNGGKLAVSAHMDDDGGGNRGAVYLYLVDKSSAGAIWGSKVTQAVKLSNDHANVSLDSNDFFGSSVSLSADGSKLAVGAIGDGDGGSNRGAVYLYLVDKSGAGATWGSKVTQAVKLSHGASLSSGTVSLGDSDFFGSDVSLSADGGKLAVGAAADDDGDGNDSGAVYLYTVAGSPWGKTVTQVVKISEKDNANDNGHVALNAKGDFGISVSLSADGSKLAVGARNDNNSEGAVYLIDIPYAGGYQSQLKGGTNVTLVASNDITINNAINADSGTGTLTLIAGRSIKINADVKVNGGLVIKANDASDSGFVLDERDTGKAEITVATGKTISGGEGDLLIKMLKGSSSAAAEKKQTGKITVWKAEGNRVSIIHSGTTDKDNDSEIVILDTGHIETTLASSGIGIELVADKFTNSSGSGALSVAGNSRYLVWTKDPSGNKMGKDDNSLIKDYSTQYDKPYDFGGGDFQSNGNQQFTFIYSSADPASGGGSGGGGGGGGGGAAILLVGAGVAIAMGGIGGGAGAGAAGATGAGGASGGVTAPTGSIDPLFNTGIYAYLNGINMQAIYQPQKSFVSVFNTPHKVTYKAKYKSQIHRTYDMTILAHNIKVQQAVPLYELDEQLYETLKRIFIQQSTPTHKTVRTDTKKV